LLGVPRSTYYHQPHGESAETLRLLRKLDELYLNYPFFGSRRVAATLKVNRKRIQRLMRIIGIEALYPKPNLSRSAPGHQIYPYLLRGIRIERPNQVWSTDITYIPMHGGFLYLVAVMDWFSRFVLSWELSNTMEIGFCLAAQEKAFRFGQPEIWKLRSRLRCPFSAPNVSSISASRTCCTTSRTSTFMKSGSSPSPLSSPALRYSAFGSSVLSFLP
jgi:putative transposase